MRALGVSLNMVMMAVGRSNLNVGGKTIEESGMEFVVRGIGLVKSVGDLEKIVLMEKEGTPIYLKDVARVELGGDFRRGVLDIDGREVVGGTVVMRTGENAHEVIKRIKAKIAQISPSLPPGVTIKPFYDRSELIDRTIETLKHALTSYSAVAESDDYKWPLSSFPPGVLKAFDLPDCYRELEKKKLRQIEPVGAEGVPV